MTQSPRYRVVYTTGAFDPFHFGHLNILRRAKAIADRLIVGVSTDDLIEQAKGRKAYMSLAQRMEILRELRCVDEVIPQTDKDKQRVVDAYGVDAIVVGSDWRGRYPDVSCVLVYIDYTENISSTLLRDNLGHGDAR